MNMQRLMQEAQKMQKDMAKKQDDLKNTEFVGNSEFLNITLMGDYQVKNIEFKVKKLDEDDMEILEDMIKIAFNDASNKIAKKNEEMMGSLGSIPGLF